MSICRLSLLFFFFSSRRRHTRFDCDWSSDVCSSDLFGLSLKSFLKDNPNDSFLRYALALEYIKLGQNDEAVREFEAVRNTDPEYVPTYYQLGQLYQKLGQKHDAEKTFRTGIAVATKAGDEHTRSELEAALEGRVSVEGPSAWKMARPNRGVR